MTIEVDVEVVRKNNHLKRLFACRLKLHATSEFRKSWRAEPGVTRQITLSGFIPSAIFSVERICARGNRASRQRQARQPTRQPSQPPKASEAVHAQHNGNTQNSLKSPRRIKYFVSFLQFARWLEDFLNRRNCSRGLLLFLFPIICAYSPILDIGPTRSKAS